MTEVNWRQQSGNTAAFDDKDYDWGQLETAIRYHSTLEDKDYDWATGDNNQVTQQH